ncbi:hypothetical protein A2U01_0091929, partial [Trifolium medium]|nr:hypothetical protein [Trifolium medium]
MQKRVPRPAQPAPHPAQVAETGNQKLHTIAPSAMAPAPSAVDRLCPGFFPTS